MLVVIEGCDGSGKTSLVHELRRNVGDSYCLSISTSRPRYDEDISSFLMAIAGLKAMIPGHVILDRFHPISELVYGSVLRGKPYSIQALQDRAAFQMVDLIVYCRPPVSQMVANLDKNPQMGGVREHMVELAERYDQLMNHLELYQEVVEYDYRRNDLSEITKRVFSCSPS